MPESRKYQGKKQCIGWDIGLTFPLSLATKGTSHLEVPIITNAHKTEHSTSAAFHGWKPESGPNTGYLIAGSGSRLAEVMIWQKFTNEDHSASVSTHNRWCRDRELSITRLSLTQHLQKNTRAAPLLHCTVHDSFILFSYSSRRNPQPTPRLIRSSTASVDQINPRPTIRPHGNWIDHLKGSNTASTGARILTLARRNGNNSAGSTSAPPS